MIRAVVFDCFGVLVEQEGQPNQELLAFIRDELKPRYRIGLLSNAEAGVVERQIGTEWLRVFDDVVVSGEVGLQKPDAAIFELAARRLEVSLQEALLVDDLTRYVTAAAQLGMQVAQYRGFERFRRELDGMLG
jgi:FMN phosphatase YigB (HAD superfamily)